MQRVKDDHSRRDWNFVLLQFAAVAIAAINLERCVCRHWFRFIVLCSLCFVIRTVQFQVALTKRTKYKAPSSKHQLSLSTPRAVRRSVSVSTSSGRRPGKSHCSVWPTFHRTWENRSGCVRHDSPSVPAHSTQRPPKPSASTSDLAQGANRD